ncbi:MAG TPA: hypothetical protein VFB66_03835 [Tepidisphaeraceae bacterium]|nr:hypothetical protein [Tepidisphaeraceae bacterium]
METTVRRTTLYAAFTGTGEPVLNVYGWNKGRLATLLADRAANGEAFPGEHAVRITVSYYNRILAGRNWPQVVR